MASFAAFCFFSVFILSSVLNHFSLVGGTPYEGGNFKVKLVLSKDFPASPPRGISTANRVKFDRLTTLNWRVSSFMKFFFCFLYCLTVPK